MSQSRLQFYEVHTETPTLREYHDKIFSDGSESGLCRVSEKKFGRAIKGCNSAAAYTTWKVLREGDAYNKDGSKHPVPVTLRAEVQLPRWKQLHEASPEERAEAQRFNMMTAYHERGHHLNGARVAQCVSSFLNHLPANVPTSQVAAVNAAVNMVIDDFYIKLGHAADKEYDRISRHGESQGALLGRHVPKQ